MISVMFLFLKQRQVLKKPLEVSPNHFQMRLLIGVEMLYLTMNNVSYDY